MIEILMATYNGDAYIREQLDSIMCQSRDDWRLTIRDDGSTDGTVDIINEYISFYPDKVRLLDDRTSSGSAMKNFIRLIKRAIGDYVMFADQDDVWNKDKVEKTYRLMKKMEAKYGTDKPLLIHTDMQVVDERLGLVSPSFCNLMKLPVKKGLNDVIIQNSIVGCTVMINDRLLDMAKQLSEDAPILMHDHALAIMAGAYGHIGFLNRPTMSYRQHAGNQVGASEGMDRMSVIRRFKQGKKAFAEDMNKSYEQVGYILDTFGEDRLDIAYDELLNGYRKLKDADSKEKRAFYKRYNVYKNSFLKKLVQIIWT